MYSPPYFWSWLVLGVKPVLFRLHDDLPPGVGDGGERLALPGQGLRPLWGKRARREGLCSAAVQSTALQMPIRRKRVLSIPAARFRAPHGTLSESIGGLLRGRKALRSPWGPLSGAAGQ